MEADVVAPPATPCPPPGREPVLILYGSQTGTAAETAAAAGRALRRLHLRVRVRSMDAIDVRELPRTPWLLCVCSTTGQGEEPDNMRALWRFLLRRALPTNSLEHTRFAVFGLGDSSYPKFNFVAKKLHKRLLSLGATTLAPLGLADDQHPLGPHAALDPWLFQVTTHLLQHFPLPLPPVPPTALLPPALPLRLVAPDDKRARQCRTAAMTYGNAVCEQATDRPYVTAARGSTHAAPQALAAGGVPDRTHPLLAPLRQNKRMTPEDHFQDVRHVILDTQHCPALTYNPGDVAYVMPENLDSNVALLFDWMEMDTGTIVEVLEPDADAPPLPPGLFVGQMLPLATLVKQHLDIRGQPARYLFELLANFTPSEMEAERLRDFITPEWQEELYDYCYRMKRTALEVLQDFPNTRGQLPVEYLFDLFGPLQPRAFSLASSAKCHPNELHLAVAVVDYKTRMSTPRTGVFTSWLTTLKPEDGAALRVWVQPGTFKVPSQGPLIAIGPVNMFFFGNRNREADFLFGAEWREMARRGMIQLYTAFSRDQPEKIYIQHVIRENGAMVWNYMSRGAVVLLAGNAKRMPVDVRDAFKDVAQKHGGLDEAASEQWMQALEASHRYQTETW